MGSESQHDGPAKWGACPAGAMVSMVERVSSERRRQQRQPLLRVGSVLLIAAVCVIGGSFVLNSREPPALGGLSCAECAEHMPAFHEGTLDATLSQQVQAHLDGCPHCREHYEINFSVDRVEATTGLAVRQRSWPEASLLRGVYDPAAPVIWVFALSDVAR